MVVEIAFDVTLDWLASVEDNAENDETTAETCEEFAELTSVTDDSAEDVTTDSLESEVLTLPSKALTLSIERVASLSEVLTLSSEALVARTQALMSEISDESVVTWLCRLPTTTMLHRLLTESDTASAWAAVAPSQEVTPMRSLGDASGAPSAWSTTADEPSIKVAFKPRSTVFRRIILQPP